MGKIKAELHIENGELRDVVEYLLAETGHFDFVKDGGDEIICVDERNMLEFLEKHFSDLLGEILDRHSLGARRKSERICKLKTIAVASMHYGFGTAKLSEALAGVLYRRGSSSAYVSLKPFNQGAVMSGNNEGGFLRWLVDSRRNDKGPIEKYSYDCGENICIGVPIFNPNAGDISIRDIGWLGELLSGYGIEYLIIDIGMHLDLEREKIFLNSDFPLIELDEDACDMHILHKYFEGAMPILASDRITEDKVRKIVESFQITVKGEDDE